MDHPLLGPGMEVLSQEFLAATRALNSRREELTAPQYGRLRQEIIDDYRLRCTQERDIAQAQMQADLDLLHARKGKHASL